MNGDDQSLLTIEYRLTDEEVSKSGSLSERARFKAENSPVKFWAIMLVIIALLGLRFYSMVLEAGLGWIAVLVVIWIVVYLTLQRISQTRKAIAVMPVTLDVRRDGLTFANGQHRSHLRWTAFSRLTETPEFFLLAVGPSGSWKVVPKRAFASKEQSDWFGIVASQQIAFAAHLVATHPLPQLQTSKRTDVAQSPATITFAPHYTLRDCLDLVFATWAYRGVVLLLLGMYIVVMGAAAREESANLDWVNALAATIPVALPSVVFAVVLTVRVRRTLHRPLNSGVSITEQGITSTGPHGDHASRWEAFNRYRETRRSFLVWHLASRAYMLVPKRCISDDDTLRWFRHLLEMRFGAPSRLFMIW